MADRPEDGWSLEVRMGRLDGRSQAISDLLDFIKSLEGREFDGPCDMERAYIEWARAQTDEIKGERALIDRELTASGRQST